jgi:hypothetical protein
LHVTKKTKEIIDPSKVEHNTIERKKISCFI